MQKEEIKKNIKDLEYSDLQHKETILLGLLGTTAVSMLVSEYSFLQRSFVLISLSIVGIAMVNYHHKKKEKIKEEITALTE